MDLDDVKTRGRGERAPDVGDLCQVYKFPEKKWVTLRMLPGLHSSGTYWVKTKKKDGKATKFPVVAPSWDTKAQVLDTSRHDPWRDFMQKEDAAGVERDDRLVQFGSSYWGQAIIRSEVKNQPARLPRHTKAEASSGFKDKESDSWTPIRVIKLPSSFARKLRELKELNVHTGKSGGSKAFAINDVKFGRDIRVYFDPDKAPAEQYNVQLGEKSRNPITEEEAAYLPWDLSFLDTREFDETEVQRDFDSWATRMKVKVAEKSADDDDDFDEDDADDAPPKKSAKKPAKKPVVKKSSKKSDDDDFDEDDADDDFDEDDADDAPPKKSAKKPVVKKSSKKSDDDDFDEDDEDDEDEDAPPRKAAPTKKSKPVDDEDAEDDFDEDDEDDEPPKKSAKKVVKKPVTKKSAAEDDDDDEDAEDDFDEDDE